jgi:hypothetical protein
VPVHGLKPVATEQPPLVGRKDKPPRCGRAGPAFSLRQMLVLETRRQCTASTQGADLLRREPAGEHVGGVVGRRRRQAALNGREVDQADAALWL